jgi:hypothetical protein
LTISTTTIYPATSAPINRKYGRVTGTKPKRPPAGVRVIVIPARTTNMLLMIRSLLA